MKLVLIGGGSIGKSGSEYETKEIDEEIVKLSNKEKPNLLFIGLANEFADSYYKLIKEIYKNLGCETGKISGKTLKNIDVVKQKIDQADIIYIGGGDTIKLVSTLKEYKMDQMLDSAIKRNCLVCGVSAGAIALCKYGLSDVEIMNKISNNYVKVEGLGFLDYMFVPHFSSDSKKKADLQTALCNTNVTSICLDNCVAIEILDNEYKIIKSKKEVKGYIAKFKNKDFLVNEIGVDKEI